MQTITKWHWANRRARCWHVTTHNRKENGRNIRKWIEKMSAPCTCAAHAPPLTPLSLLIASSKQPRMGTGGTSCFVEQVRSHSLCFCRVWVKVFWVICPHNQCESVVHTHTHTHVLAHTHVAVRLFVLSGHELLAQSARSDSHRARARQSITQNTPLCPAWT